MANGIPIIDANCIFGFWPLRRAEVTLPTLIQTAQAAGVARCIALSTTGLFYDYRAGNEETLAAAQANAQTLFPVATIDPRQQLDLLAEIDKRAGQGFRLFRFFPNLQEWPLTFAPFRQALAKLDEMRIPAMIDIAAAGQATQIADLVTLHSTPIIFAGVNHANLGEAIAVARSDAKVHLETHALDSPDALELLAAEVGVERLIFGSGAPLRFLSSALLPVLAAPLNDEQKAAVLGGNIRRLFTGK